MTDITSATMDALQGNAEDYLCDYTERGTMDGVGEWSARCTLIAGHSGQHEMGEPE